MGRILRSELVQLEDRMTLGTTMVVPGPAADTRPLDTTFGGQARVVETHADHSVIEVVCGCGQVLHLRCEHGK